MLHVYRACASNSVNKQNMIQDFLPAVQEFLPEDLGTYATILQICSDHSEYLQLLDDRVFVEQIALLKTTTSAEMVQIMIETCHCDGEPLLKNQQRWVKLLVQEAPELIPSMKLLDGRVLISHVLLNQTHTLCVNDLHAKIKGGCSEGVAKQDEDLFAYQLRVLELLASLVQGRNSQAIRAIETLSENKGFSYWQLLQVSVVGSGSRI